MNSKIFLLFVIISAIFYWVINPFYKSEAEKVESLQKVETVEIDSLISVSFSAVGDIMCHSTQYNYAWVENDSFDFNPVFSVVGNYLREKDILIGNLETVLAGNTKKFSGYPFFNSPNELASAIKNAGFDFLTLANNHASDQGLAGIERTIDVLKKVNIIPLGANISDSSDNSNIFVRNGLRFGMLSYTYGTNYNANFSNPRKFINHIDTVKIKNDIAKLKSKNADLIIVLFHFGEQYQKKINSYQKNIVDKTKSYGADIIIGAHPHIIQKFEKFKTVDANLDSGFVVYSLGNFVSNQRWRYSDGGIIFNFEITKNIFTDSVYVSDINYLPIWVFKGTTEKGKEFIVLPSENFDSTNVYNFMTKADIDSMKRSYFDSVEQMTSESQIPKIDHLKNQQ
ncbi:MAG: CapA family protein [Ignavibacteriales bacterium]|nr:CapA family protein [Ignavibacteriales bacterium]